MLLAGKQKLGYFPLPLAEAERIRRFLQFPLSGYAALDPCIGDGGAFTVIAGNPLETHPESPPATVDSSFGAPNWGLEDQRKVEKVLDFSCIYDIA